MNTRRSRPANKDEAIALGVDQIRRNHRETPQLFLSQHLFTATAAIGFFYGATWNTVGRNIFLWKCEPHGRSLEPQIAQMGADKDSGKHLRKSAVKNSDLPGWLEARV